jgi:anti-sigma B factor antagonist
MNLAMDVQTSPGRSVLTVAGEVDVYTAPELQTRITALADSGQRQLVIDLAGVGFMDSTGLGALVAARDHVIATGGDLTLARVPARVGLLLRITGLDQAFPLDAESGLPA